MQEMSDATARWARGTGAEFFGTLNVLVEASVRAGCASPGLLPTGMVLLETTGAKSGLPRRVPLLATVLEGCLFIGTACGARSQWLRNLRAEPRVRVRIRAVAQQPPRVGMTRHGGGFGQRHAAAIEATRNAERCARKPQDAEHDPRGTRNDNGLQRNH